MSLLLDALKKAEKAKEDAKRKSQSTEVADPDATVVQVRTRNELPDISKPLEFHSEDVAGAAAVPSGNPVPDAFSTAPAAQSAPPAMPRHDAGGNPATKAKSQPKTAQTALDAQAAQRSSAKHVFEAKFREPNPKLPFYITMGLLGAFALGTVVYFWFQLRPPPPLVNTNPKPPVDEKKLEPVAAAPGSTQISQPQTSVAPSVPAISGLPAQSPAAPAVPVVPATKAAQAQLAPQQTPGPAAQPSTLNSSAPRGAERVVPRSPARETAQDSTPTPNRVAGANSARQRESKSTRPADDPSKLSVNRPAPAVHPKLEAGWQAYNQGDLKSSRSNYQDVLKEEPANRDALLGMAALEVKANRLEQAEIYYRTVLQANPRDSYAQAGLMALRAQVGDPVQGESRMKNLLANDPEAQILQFTLGNQYAQQGRWPEAQQAYFKAYSAEPENPDFAYNLAVSLDHVKQPKLALEYYRRAIALAQQRSSNFDKALALNRIQQLTK
jgi:Tfp pilus assembly protein PilF